MDCSIPRINVIPAGTDDCATPVGSQLGNGRQQGIEPRVPYVRLNPLLTTIPELAPDRGGTIIGASRDYVDPRDRAVHPGDC